MSANTAIEDMLNMAGRVEGSGESAVYVETYAGVWDYLVAQTAHKRWPEPSPVVRVQRLLSEFAQCENKARGRMHAKNAGDPNWINAQGLRGSTCRTVMRDFCALMEGGESFAGAFSAVKEKCAVDADGAGDRARGTRSDAAAAFARMRRA